MKLFHLTPKKTYEDHIKKEGLKPQPIDPKWWGSKTVKCKKGIFCWPEYSNELLHDWILFNKSKTSNKDDDFVLLEIHISKNMLLKPPKKDDTLKFCHTLSVASNGSHGETTSSPHTEVPMCIIIKKIKPANIIPIKKISTFVVVEI